MTGPERSNRIAKIAQYRENARRELVELVLPLTRDLDREVGDTAIWITVGPVSRHGTRIHVHDSVSGARTVEIIDLIWPVRCMEDELSRLKIALIAQRRSFVANHPN